MEEKTIKIVQINSVLLNGDAISNIMRAVHSIKDSKIESFMALELFADNATSQILQMAISDYMPLDIPYTIKRYMHIENKFLYLKKYLAARKAYKSQQAKHIIDNADIRIWHFGIYYPLMMFLHAHDIIYFHNITYPYLANSESAAANISSRLSLQALKDLDPYFIADSQFDKKTLLLMGFPEKSIKVLPPPLNATASNLPYIPRHPAMSKPIAWGRYAINKGIPELVQLCNNARYRLRVFGDNDQLKEFKDEFKKATASNTNEYATLSGKVDNFEKELSEANIYICNSYHEGFNMPLIEAEAHSLPVLARRGTAMDELVKDGYNGFLFSDISEVPGLIAKIMKNYKQMSYNAWQHSQNFTYEKFKQNYLRILSEYAKVRK